MEVLNSMNDEKKNEKNFLDMIPEEDRGDIIMLRMVLKSVTEFLKEAKEPIEDLFKVLGTSLDGGKIGQDVAKFYQSLIESGIPEDMAKQMTTEYFHKRLEAANIIGSLTNLLGKGSFKLGELKKILGKVSEEKDEVLEEEEE
jgi:hypothetical protein